jgi:hypothetical protein
MMLSRMSSRFNVESAATVLPLRGCVMATAGRAGSVCGWPFSRGMSLLNRGSYDKMPV